MGNPKSVKGDSSSLNEVTLDYYPGAPGKLQSVTDGRGKMTSYEYDSAGNLTKITPPAPLGTTQIAYNTQLSRISSTTDGKGQTTTITYDPLDRPTRYDYSDGSSVVLTYDADGNITSRVDQTGTTVNTVDQLNRVTNTSLPGSRSNAYAYDGVGNLKSVTDSGGTVSYAYDAANQLDSLTEPGGAVTSFDQDANGNRKTTAYPNGVTVAEIFDDASRVKEIKSTKAGGTILHKLNYSYTESVAGNPDKERALRQSVTDKDGNKTAYSYDGLDRLTEAQTKNSAGTVTDSYSYGYDRASNRTSQTVNGTVTSYAYGDANQLCWRFSGSSTNACGSPPAGATTYTYDAGGNETQNSSGRSLAYNAKNRTRA